MDKRLLKGPMPEICFWGWWTCTFWPRCDPTWSFRLRTDKGLELLDLPQVLSSLIPCTQTRASGRCSHIAETRKHWGRHFTQSMSAQRHAVLAKVGFYSFVLCPAWRTPFILCCSSTDGRLRQEQTQRKSNSCWTSLYRYHSMFSLPGGAPVPQTERRKQCMELIFHD